MGSDLNASYYGPSVPPAKRSHRPSRGGSNCFCCLGGCLLRCVFRLIISILCTILAIAAVVALILWLIFRPNLLKFHASDASLSRFNLTANNTLRYDLALNLTIRNPNKRLGVYYDRIELRPFYQAHRLDSKLLTPFYQGHKNTTDLTAAFSGQQVVLLGGDEFAKDRAAGVYDIDVKLYLRLRLKFGIFKSPRFSRRIDCGLKVPLGSANATTTSSFQRTKCDFDFF